MVQFTRKNFLSIVCAILSLFLLITTSVYAVDEYMKLKLSFIASPAVSCTVEMKVKDVSAGNTFTSYYTVYSNAVAENINASISRKIKGSTISLGGGIFANLEANDEITIKITNNSPDTTKTMSVTINNPSAEGATLNFVVEETSVETITVNNIASNAYTEIAGVVNTLTVSKLNLAFHFSLVAVAP